MLRRARRRLAGESGNVLITVVLVSMIIGALAAAALRTGEHAQTSSASDRNHQAALAVAESGVHDAIAKINAQINADPSSYDGCSGDPNDTEPCTLDLQTPDGKYLLTIARIDDGFVLDSRAQTGGDLLGRDRRIRVTLLPPRLFDAQYALFSFTSIDVKNNDAITGDVWANDSVLIRADTRIDGSVTAATSWIKLENKAGISGFAWSGGFNSTTSRAIDIGNAPSDRPSVGAWAKASVSSPSDPETCNGEPKASYTVANNGNVVGDITSWSATMSGNEPGGTFHPDRCTAAPPIKPLPAFNFNAANYDSVQEFSSVAAFQEWLNIGTNRDALQGTFKIDEPSPSQTCANPLTNPETCRRVDLSGVSLAGDLTIVTNAPVYTNSMDDEPIITERPLMFIVSHYDPPTGTSCDVNNDNSECAIHAKNGFAFDGDCKTAALLYADEGPVAVKNNQGMCGSILSEGILIKNNQVLKYDDRVDRVIGFGETTYEIARWEECPVSSGCAP